MLRLLASLQMQSLEIPAHSRGLSIQVTNAKYRRWNALVEKNDNINLLTGQSCHKFSLFDHIMYVWDNISVSLYTASCFEVLFDSYPGNRVPLQGGPSTQDIQHKEGARYWIYLFYHAYCTHFTYVPSIIYTSIYCLYAQMCSKSSTQETANKIIPHKALRRAWSTFRYHSLPTFGGD